jgi:hypothetical protein
VFIFSRKSTNINQKQNILFLKSNQKFLERNYWVETNEPKPLLLYVFLCNQSENVIPWLKHMQRYIFYIFRTFLQKNDLFFIFKLHLASYIFKKFNRKFLEKYVFYLENFKVFKGAQILDQSIITHILWKQKSWILRKNGSEKKTPVKIKSKIQYPSINFDF